MFNVCYLTYICISFVFSIKNHFKMRMAHFISLFYFHVKMYVFDPPPFFNLLACIKLLNLWYQYKRLKNHVKLEKPTKILSMIFQNIQLILSAGIIVLLLEVSWLFFQ